MGEQDIHDYVSLLDRNAADHGASPALIGEACSVTHAELRTCVGRVAQRLAAQGVGRGDRVAVLALNGAIFFELIGAAALLGAVVVLLNTRASASETAAVLADSGARCVFADASLKALLREALPGLPCYGCNEEGLDAGEDDQAIGHGVSEPIDASTPLLAIPTAAVDGRPRLALLSHAALMHQAERISQVWELGSTDRHLCVLPLFHLAGLGLAVAVQSVAGANVLMRQFEPGAAARAIGQERVSCFASFSPILGAILDAARSGDADLSSLRTMTGLESLDVIERLQREWPTAVFWSGYGQTETGGLVCLAPATECPGAAGRPMAGVELRIENVAGDACATDESGEIVVRSPGVFSGYWNRPEQTAHASRGGWHHTGDLGRLDREGYLWFLGPAPDKALIKSGGENIYPVEVEQVLCAHPAVHSAVVIGIPDANWGQTVRAVCQLRPGHNVTAQELVDFVGARIARFKRPRDVVFVPTMPLNQGGAVDRARIVATFGEQTPG